MDYSRLNNISKILGSKQRVRLYGYGGDNTDTDIGFGNIDDANKSLGHIRDHQVDGGPAAIKAFNRDQNTGDIIYDNPYLLDEVTVKGNYAPMIAKKTREGMNNVAEQMAPLYDLALSATPIGPVYGAIMAYRDLTSDDGVSKTIDYLRKGDWQNAGLSAGADALNITDLIPGGRLFRGSKKFASNIIPRKNVNLQKTKYIIDNNDISDASFDLGIRQIEPFQPVTDAQEILENYNRRSGRVPSTKYADEIIHEGMNVKQLAIEDLIWKQMQDHPGISRMDAIINAKRELAKEGVSFNDILNSNGLNIQFENPEWAKYNGNYMERSNPYRESMVSTHEDNHLSRGHADSNNLTEYSADGFRTPNNPEERYIDDREKSSFGTEILNILGKTAYDLTGDELRLLHDNIDRIRDNQYIKMMLDMITDYDKAAKWINEHSNIVVGATGTALGAGWIQSQNDNNEYHY